MKVKIELDDALSEIEVIIRSPKLSADLARLQEALEQTQKPLLIFYKGTSEYYIEVGDILFFETDGTKIYGHTRDNAYEVKLKLYELEDCLPNYFCRIAKASIANVKQIYAIDRSFSGTSSIQFYETHKQAHVSRHYYHLLKEKLQEMR